MSDLVEFLRARLDEDEAAARAATAGRWEARDLGDAVFNSADGKGWWWVWRAGVPHYAGVMEVDHDDPGAPIGTAAITDFDHGSTERADAEHIARWDPVRVLAEVEAKRQALLTREQGVCTCGPGDGYENPPTDPDTREPIPHHYDCAAYTAALLFVQVYADHPDFDPGWGVA